MCALPHLYLEAIIVKIIVTETLADLRCHTLQGSQRG